MAPNEILTMHRITKNFIGVTALDNVDFTLRAGEIHALMGENGAGKSTLIKVLTGAEEFEEGEIKIAGKEHPIINRSPQEAQNNGISTVYQEINLCPNLSVAENLFIGREPKKLGRIDWKTMNKKAEGILHDLDLHIDVTLTLDNYSVAVQQMVAIARAVDMSSKVLVLDEPTSSLDEREAERLFQVMRMLKERGLGIIFITHFLEQVYEVCDRITVLRNGKLIGEFGIKDLPPLKLVACMMGKDIDILEDIKEEQSSFRDKDENEIIVEVGKSVNQGRIEPFDLTVYKGDIIGLSGLLGSGRSELARSLFGADNIHHSEFKINGRKIVINKPIDAIKAGMAFLPEDRKVEGVIADLSVQENIIIALQAKRGMLKLLNKKDQEEFAQRYIDVLNIKTPSRGTPVKQLSGGNQQKVILARWLLLNPYFLILDEPTRGIDVGTKTEIQRLIIDLSKKGKAIIFISSEIEEMLRTCNRMLVMRDYAVVGEFWGDAINQDNIMTAIAGGEKYE